MTTTSSPYESHSPRGRPDDGAAAARTEELYGRYNRTVTGLCRALLRDRAEAEDAVQQTFLSAHRALLNGGDPREPAAWLATIARNECWARIRTRMREPLAVEEVDTVVQSDPLSEAIRRADLAALWCEIEALPRQQRDALLLREFGGLTYEELAEALAISGSAVESLLFRARTRLRLQLRAGYASFAGASGLEALARVFAGGSAPVAAKVAALGVGAAAVGGSAVVVPHAFENHMHMRPPAQKQEQARSVRRPAPPAPALSSIGLDIAAVTPVQEEPRPAVRVTTTAEHDDDRGRGDEGEHAGGDGDRHLSSGRGEDPDDGRSESSSGGGEGRSGGDEGDSDDEHGSSSGPGNGGEGSDSGSGDD